MRIIELTQGKETRVCDCHYNLVKDFKWHFNTDYARSKAAITYFKEYAATNKMGV